MAQQGSASPLRFCYLDCEDAQKWAGHEQLARGILQPGAAWEHYRCWNRELPSLESLSERCDGVLISGSHYSCYEDRLWIRELEEWLRQAVAQHPRVRFLGMCFGCQVLAQALGGRVGKNVDGRFVLGVEKIRLRPALQRSAALRLAAADTAAAAAGGGADAGASAAEPASRSSNGSSSSSYADGSTLAGGAGRSSSGSPANGGGAGSSGDARDGDSIASVRLIESHGDCVLELPPGAVLLAESGTAPTEMWTVPAGNVLAVQGHAELTAADTLEKIHTAITAAGRLSAEEAEESERSLREDPADSQLVLHLYRRFMELGLPEAAAYASSGGSDGSNAGINGGSPPEAAVQGASVGAGSPAGAVTAGTAKRNAEAGDLLISADSLPISTPAGGCAAAEAGVLPAAGGDSAASGAGSPVAAAAAAGSAASAAAASTAAHLLQQLQLAVGAELGKPLSEQQLLRQCNEAAAARYQQLGDAAAAARGRLEELARERQQHAQAGQPLTQVLDELEAQVQALEGTMAQLDASSRRLQARLASTGAAGCGSGSNS